MAVRALLITGCFPSPRGHPFHEIADRRSRDEGPGGVPVARHRLRAKITFLALRHREQAVEVLRQPGQRRLSEPRLLA